MSENQIIVVKAHKLWVWKIKKFCRSMIGKSLALAIAVTASICIGNTAVTQYQVEQKRLAAEQQRLGAEQQRLADEARFTTYDVPLLGIVKIEK